jgi:hypothetical protein
MKKIKAVFCMLLLSTVLVGNVFAGGFTTLGGFSFFDSVINAIVLMTRASTDCDVRICTNCKPGTVNDGNGNCRPTE